MGGVKLPSLSSKKTQILHNPPRHHAIKTGLLIAVYHWRMRGKTDFCQFVAHSLAGQSIIVHTALNYLDIRFKQKKTNLQSKQYYHKFCY